MMLLIDKEDDTFEEYDTSLEHNTKKCNKPS